MNIHNKINALLNTLWPGSAFQDHYTPGKIHRFSTHPKKRHDKSGWVLVFHDQRGGVVGDYRTDFQQYVAADSDNLPPAEMRRILAQAKRQQEQEHLDLVQSYVRSKEQNRILWDEGNQITRHDAAGKYLMNRKVFGEGGNIDQAMRFHDAVPYFEVGQFLGYFPAMLAAITNVSGEMVAIHRTYLDPLGTKAKVPSPRKITRGSAPLAGCSIKLLKSRPVEGVQTIALAEGIETAWAVHHLNGFPVEATVSANLLARYVWHPSMERLVICADNDENGTGQRSARTLATRAQQAGLDCRILTPKTPGWDWADVLVSRLNMKEGK